jgi:hypothetical protein
MIEDYIFFDYVKEIKSLSVREKRFVGLLIAGIVAAITAIATMTTAEVALSQSIQNAHYILTGKMSVVPINNKLLQMKKLIYT